MGDRAKWLGAVAYPARQGRLALSLKGTKVRKCECGAAGAGGDQCFFVFCVFRVFVGSQRRAGSL